MHLNCQHLTDNVGDIKLDFTKSRQNICVSYYLKLHQFDVNRRDVNAGWMQLENDVIVLITPELSAYY